MNVFLLLLCFSVVQTDDQLISKLASDDKVEASAAYKALNSRGVEAFPALIARLEDQTHANYDAFHNPTVMIKTTRSWAIYKPRISDVTFDLIQQQIEGIWPEGFRHHYALTHENAKAWLNKYRGLSLKQLQLLAITDSLSSVAWELAAKPNEDLDSSCLAYLTERLARIQAPAGER